jgi:hypothetical protein
LKRSLTILFIVLIITPILSQDAKWFSGYKTVIPGKNYEAGWFHELFFGSHWREVWCTPVKVPVIDMQKYGDGLTPTEKGGGLQTKGLKFKGADGNEYKFRSMDKDPKKTLSPELQESIAKDIIQDQISSSNPYAGFVVNPILDAVGVYHSDYTLVILPDDPSLGEFRKDFGGLLGIMEIVPQAGQFEGSDKVISTVKLLDRLNKEYDEEVDAKEFLKARLIDIFLGDWDRHKDQWKWIRFEEGEKKIYKPFPMDRDQAFAEFDGLLPFIAEQNVPQLNHFGYSYPDMRFMTWSGRYIDQRFLTFISKEDWDKVTNEVVGKLTNEVIESSVKKLPNEVYKISKDEIIEKLKSRRDGLKEASEDYYELVNSVVDIYLTDKDDYVLIGQNSESISKGSSAKPEFRIRVEKLNKENDSNRTFIKSKSYGSFVPDEVRIYLQDGDDKVVVINKDLDMPKIRIIGGDGKDEVRNESEDKVYFYDDGKKSKSSGNVGFCSDKFKTEYEKAEKKFKKVKKELTKDDKKKYEEEIAGLKYDPVVPPDKFDMVSFIPILYYSPDIGIFFGGTYNYTKFGFRMNPYLYKLQFTLGYAPEKNGIKGLVADFNSDFLGLIKRTDVNFHVRKSGIEVNNFFGKGNNTSFSDSLYNNKYYKVDHEQYMGDLSFIFPFGNMLKFSLGIGLKHFRVEDKANTITNIVDFDSTGIKKVNLSFLKGGIEYDKRDNTSAPYTGYYAAANGYYSPKVFNDAFEFGKVTGDLRGYLGYKTRISLALRAYGEKIIGNSFPYFESAFLGGQKSLRGFPSERYAGDGSVMGSAELRLRLFNYNILLPQSFGIFGFGETGRVYLKGEDSKKWHASYGGGMFIHLLSRAFTFKFTFARSDEKDLLFYFNTGFGF